MSKLGRMMAFLLVGLITLPACLHATEPGSTSCDTYLREKSPKFRVARKIQSEDKQSVTIFVSVDPTDISRDKLLTVVCGLGRTYARSQTLVVWVLDDYRAATRFNPQGEGNDSATTIAFRASYYFSREKNEQSFGWLPDVHNHSNKVEVDLGPPPVPSP
jgi:hypothetical protein